MVTPLRKAASNEPRIAILGIWSDTRLARGKYGIYVAVRGNYGPVTGSTRRLLEILPRKNQQFLLSCLLSDGNEDIQASLVLRNIRGTT